MNPHVPALLNLASESLDVARLNADNGFYRAAVSRAYYAAFYAARAAVLAQGLTAKSHKAVLIHFHQHYAKPGRIDRAHAAALTRLQDLRLVADYDDGALLDAAQTDDALQKAAGVVQAVRAVLEEV